MDIFWRRFLGEDKKLEMEKDRKLNENGGEWDIDGEGREWNGNGRPNLSILDFGGILSNFEYLDLKRAFCCYSDFICLILNQISEMF